MDSEVKQDSNMDAIAKTVNSTPNSTDYNKSHIFIYSSLAAVALVAIIIGIILGIKPQTRDNNLINTPTPVISTIATPAPSITNVPISATNAPTAKLTTIPTADQDILVTAPNIYQFTSPELGITFKYTKNYTGGNVAVKREGNKVYIYPTSGNYKDGQYVEVFSKKESVSMQNDINTRFLKGYSSTDCYTIGYYVSGLPWPSGYEVLQIDTPIANNAEDQNNKVKLCPPVYTTGNGISYFEGSNIRPDKYVFLSIGQYAIGGDTEQNAWQDTFRFLSK